MRSNAKDGGSLCSFMSKNLALSQSNCSIAVMIIIILRQKVVATFHLNQQLDYKANSRVEVVEQQTHSGDEIEYVTIFSEDHISLASYSKYSILDCGTVQIF